MLHNRHRKNRHRTLHIGLMAVLLSAAYTTSSAGWTGSGTVAAAASSSGAAFSQAADRARLADDESSHHNKHVTGGQHRHEEGHKQAVNVQWSFSPRQPAAGKTAVIELVITDMNGKLVRDFTVSHEKEIHLIAVSSDLSEFQHLHPVEQGSGRFTVDTIFPKGGAYQLFADFMPDGGAHQVARTEVEVGGKSAAAVPIVQDKQLVKTVGDTQVILQTGPLAAGKETALAFSFKDARTGIPVQDMEPYLGAAGHVVIISSDLEHYLHVHPKEGQTAGPEAIFETAFPAPGLYRVWGQFQRPGDIFTVSFTIKVIE